MDQFSRRSFVAGTLPGAALVGAGLSAFTALGQQGKEDRRDDRRGERIHEADREGHPHGEGVIRKLLADAFVEDEYRLPALPYPFNALEPHIDGPTMQFHHDKHHKAYVDGLNRSLGQLATMRNKKIFDNLRLSALEKDVSFNAGGHFLHCVFWGAMSPGGPQQPEGELGQAINDDFGSFDAFTNQFTRVALSVKGSGWALLAYEPVSDGLVLSGANQHDTNLVPGAPVLLPLDVWEHAYYLKYQNNRADYVRAWWNTVNWHAVGQWYHYVRSMYLEPEHRTPKRRVIKLFEFEEG